MSSDLRQPRAARTALALLAGLVLAAGCAPLERGEDSPESETPGETPGETPDGGGGGAVSYATAVHPLLLSGCQSCHAPGGPAGDTAFRLTGTAADDLTNSVALVDTGTPENSRLLRKGAGVGHGGGAIFPAGSPEYTTLLSWISAGAAP